MSKKPIGLLYAGGCPDLSTAADFAVWNEQFFELDLVGPVTALWALPQVTSPEHCVSLLKQLDHVWDQYRGFIITLPHTNLLYFAALLAFMAGRRAGGKPIVLTTGAQLLAPSDDYSELGFKANILNAAQAVHADVRGVVLAYGSVVLPVTAARLDGKEPLTLESRKGVQLAQFDFGVRLSGTAQVAAGPAQFTLTAGNVPLISADTLNALTAVSPRSDGIIIDGGDSLTLSVIQAIPAGVPALLLSREGVSLFVDGRIEMIQGLTPAVAAAKFTWLLGQDDDKPLLERLQLPVIDEIITPDL